MFPFAYYWEVSCIQITFEDNSQLVKERIQIQNIFDLLCTLKHLLTELGSI